MVIQKGPLFRLPRELRNQITAYVLIPGIVYIKPLRLPSCDASRHAKEEPHSAVLGFGYLATCQQAYEEGHQMFYSQNTFFLPPGWLLYTQCWERDLRSEHRGLIQSLGIGMGLLDIQSQEFCDCDAVTGPSSGRPERTLWANDIDRFLEHDGEIMTESAHMFIEATGVGEMRGMWQEKLRWMRACDWDSVQEMVVANETSKVAFRRDLLPSKINISEDTDDEKLDELLNSATESVTAVIGAGLDALSNADTEAWVEAGAPLGVYDGKSLHIRQRCVSTQILIMTEMSLVDDAVSAMVAGKSIGLAKARNCKEVLPCKITPWGASPSNIWLSSPHRYVPCVSSRYHTNTSSDPYALILMIVLLACPA